MKSREGECKQLFQTCRGDVGRDAIRVLLSHTSQQWR